MSRASRSRRAVAAVSLSALASAAAVSGASAFDMMNPGGHGPAGGGLGGGGAARGFGGGGMAAPRPAFVPHFAPPPPHFAAPPRVMSPPRVVATPHVVSPPHVVATPHFVSPPRVVATPHVAPTPHFVAPHLVGARPFGGGVRPSFGHNVPTHGSVTSLAHLPLGHAEPLASVHTHHPQKEPPSAPHPITPASMPIPPCIATGCGPVQAKIPGTHVVLPGHLHPLHLDPGVLNPDAHLPPGIIISQPPVGPLHVIGHGFNPPKLPILPLPKGPGGLTFKDPGFTQKDPGGLTPKDPGGLTPIGLPIIPLPIPVPIPVDQQITVLEPLPLVPVPPEVVTVPVAPQTVAVPVATGTVAVPVAVPAATAAVGRPVAMRGGALAAPIAAVAAPTCGLISSDLSITFQPAITAADIANFIKGYNVAMADGPNVDGVYRLRLLQPGLTQAQIAQIVASMQGQTAYVASVTPQPAPALPTTRTACGTYVSVTFVPTIHSVDVTTFLKAYNVTMSDGTKPDGSYTVRLSDQAIPSATIDKIVDSMKGQAAFVSNVAKL